MDVMTMKMDAQYKTMKSCTECNHYGGNHSTAYCKDDDTPMSREEEAKFMQTFRRTRFYNNYRDRDANHDNWNSSERKQKQLNLEVGSERIVFTIDSEMKHSYSNDDTCFSIDVNDEIFKEYFDTLLDERRKIIYSIEETPLKDTIFVEFDEFIAMNIEENTKPEINEE
uniref:Reverse transcriptase domain-containing protein n=1 Tax=Tanacetum cinerariifolium TaxID=118510 RepID=A0A6L2NT58_TANCI|nr:reverse transcriptase domain-containing protein [Tanacetum cinerariifolium]